MNLLLDTCAFIWAVAEPDKFPPPSRDALTTQQNTVFISSISCAEIACLADRNKIKLDCHWKTWFNRYVKINSWICLDMSLEIIQEAYSLPGTFQQDPADRIIVATARTNNFVIVTADQKIIDYPHADTIWQ